MRRQLAAAVSLSLVAGSLGLATGGIQQASAAVQRCFGQTATIVGTSGDDILVGTPGPDVIVGLGGNDTIKGRGGRDLICAGAGDDIVLGQGGSDRIQGNAGSDILVGGPGNDLLAGGAGADALLGQQGNDKYIGGSGIDLVAFLTAEQGIVADIRDGIAQGEGNDTLKSVEGLVGSDYNDRLRGDRRVNFLVGAGGNDLLHGRGGNDFAMYSLASAGVVVDLLAGTATGGEGKDRLRAIENAIGSPYDDGLKGTSGDNYLDGAEGTDTIDGRGGNDDVCLGEVQTNCPPVFAYADEPPTLALSGLTGLDLSFVPRSAPTDQPSVGILWNTANCYQGENVARFRLPPLSGYGLFGYQIYGQSGWSPLRFAQAIFYHDGNGWQYYINGIWYSFQQAGWSVAGDHTWIHGWYYSAQTGQYEDLGQCLTNPGGVAIYGLR